jgi:hypothetical protein
VTLTIDALIIQRRLLSYAASLEHLAGVDRAEDDEREHPAEPSPSIARLEAQAMAVRAAVRYAMQPFTEGT